MSVNNKKQKVDTPYLNSWADEESKRRAAYTGGYHPLAPKEQGIKLEGTFNRLGQRIK